MPLRWIFSEMHPGCERLAAPRGMKPTVDIWLHHHGRQGVGPAICLSALLICLINQRIQVNFLATSCQFISISCQCWRYKALQSTSFNSPGPSFASTKAKQNCTGAKLCSAKLQATGTKNEHLPWYIQIIQSFAPMCMVEQSFALVHIRHATVLLQNFVPVACNFVLHLWLAPLCCKALPLYSSALQLVLRRAFYLQHWQLIEMNWQLVTMKLYNLFINIPFCRPLCLSDYLSV